MRAALDSWICDACTRIFEDDEPPPICPGCGVQGAFSKCDAPSDEESEGADALPTLADPAPRVQLVKTGTPLDSLIGGFARGTTTAVHGSRGSGKSTLCLSVAAGLALSLGSRALVVCPEMSHAILGTTARFVARKDLLVRCPDHLAWKLHAARTRALVVLVDSVSVFPDPLATTNVLIDWARDSNGVAIALLHETKAGDASGSTALTHNVDAVLRLSRRGRTRRVSIDGKCRWSEEQIASVAL